MGFYTYKTSSSTTNPIRWNKFWQSTNFQATQLLHESYTSWRYIRYKTITAQTAARHFYNNTRPNVKGITLFYNLAQDKHVFKKSTTIRKWERELGITFSDTQWLNALKEIHKSSHCVKHWEMTIKLINRWHYTPFRLAKYYPDKSPLCWRNCGYIGNLLHTLWECPSIKSLWNQIFKIISSITGNITTTNPALAILHIGIEKFPPQFRSVISHILLETRNLILRKWKDNSCTNSSDVIKHVQRNHTFERLIAINAMHCETFDKNWLIWSENYCNIWYVSTTLPNI